jgi:hypothetical protein
MTRSRYEMSLSATLIDAARAALGQQLPHHVPVLHEPTGDMRQLLARLVAVEDAKRRAAEHQFAASLPLPGPYWPHA